jgi:carboxymethylenebutenolidase
VNAEAISKPMLAHWALHDEFFAAAGVDQLEEKLKHAGVNYEFHRYDTKHAFANPKSDSRGMPPLKYDADAAKLAWDRTLDFLKKHLT